MKKIFALILALCMCFALAACGEDKEEDVSKAEKMYKKYKEIISFMEDGDYEAAYDAMVSLAGENFGGDENGDDALGAFEDVFECLSKEDYSGAIEAIIRLENSKNQKEPTDLMELLCNEWYGATFSYQEMPVERSISFSADGTCNVLDQNLNWTVEWENENRLDLKLYSGSTEMYTAELYLHENDVSRVYIYDSQDSGRGVGAFYLDPMMIYALRDWDRLDDTVTELPSSFYLDTTELRVNSEHYSCTVASQIGDAELVIHASDKKSGAHCYTVKIFVRDDRYVTELTDENNGLSTLYYSEYTGGYSKDWSEYRYYYATDKLNNLLNGSSSIWVDEVYYSGYDAWAKVYELFSLCRGYKDTDAILGDFVKVEKMLTDSKLFRKDHLDNESNSSWNSYEYDSQGRLTFADSLEVEMLLFGSYNSNTSYYYFNYDENGKLSSIHYGSSTDVRAIFTPTYDAAGNIVSMEVKNNSGTYTNYYTYDADGRLLTAVYSTVEESNVRRSNYTYDASGKLLKVEGVIYRSGHYEYDIVYTYDANGNLDTKTMNLYRSRYYDWYEDEYISFDYTCDADGDPISAVVTGTDYTSFASVTLQYAWKDLYFYKP